MQVNSPSPEVRALDDDALRAWPLQMPSSEGDKEERGRLLVIAGSREMPGAAVLAATAALRAGAGKLAIASGERAAGSIALAVPEARVVALPETAAGGIDPDAADLLTQLKRPFDAILIGPGMQDETSTCELAVRLLTALAPTSVILDATAMGAVKHTRESSVPVLITPHAGEMAHLLGIAKEAINEDPLPIACEAAMRWNAAVALKGATTFIAMPGAHTWRHAGGNAGLAISGSGDVLAGIIAGLAARGAALDQAAAWGVALHARAGDRLSARVGPLGYLAREISAEVPGIMHALSSG
jgi:ADP-dependent NAD(P)H-hydrate dehydratase